MYFLAIFSVFRKNYLFFRKISLVGLVPDFSFYWKVSKVIVFMYLGALRLHFWGESESKNSKKHFKNPWSIRIYYRTQTQQASDFIYSTESWRKRKREKGAKMYSENGMQERDQKLEQLQRMSRHLLHDESEREKCVCARERERKRERERESRQWSISINCQDDVSLRHTSTLSSRKSEQGRSGSKNFFSLLLLKKDEQLRQPPLHHRVLEEEESRPFKYFFHW